MYQAFIKNGEEWIYLFHSHDERIMLIEPVLIRKLNRSGCFTFQVPPTHPNYNKILPYSEIFLYEDKDDNVEPIFSGRVMSLQQDFNNVLEVSCEGEMGYLRDSMQRPFEYTGSMYDLFTQLIKIHNGQVEERKRFEIGDITVADRGTDQIIKTTTEYMTTMDVIMSQFVNVYGGYVRVRWKDGKKYIDYVSDYGGINSQSIRFGENLLDLETFVDPTTVYTALIPVGAELEDGTIINIADVNNGVDFIIDQEAYEKYGWKCIQKTWEDVTDPATLLLKAKAYLKEKTALTQAIELTAFDLNMIDVDIEKLVFGYWTTVESPPHNMKYKFLLSSQTTYLMDPAQNKIVLGGQMPSFNAQVADNNHNTKYKIGHVSSTMTKKIENATQLITGGKGGYVVLDITDPDTGKKMHPWRILIMDTPEKETAKSVIQINKNGIGFSTTGINGPYRNAWTIDGNLVADFITTGSMLADRIRGGILEVGGKELAANGKIVVKNANGKEIGRWDNTGLHVYLGVIEGSKIIGSDIVGSTIDVGPFSADPFQVCLGDFYVSTDGSNVLRTNDGSVVIQTAKGGPFGKYAALTLSSQSGTTTLSDHHMETQLIDVKRINGDCRLYGNNWWQDYTLFGALDYLYDEIKNLKA